MAATVHGTGDVEWLSGPRHGLARAALHARLAHAPGLGRRARISGSDPAIFLAHDAAVTKRWAEQLRYQRGTNTAGFMLFAAECWASHSFDSASLKPYPTFEAIKQAWAPIGIALESGRRRFYAGEEFETVVFISNDTDDFSDLGSSVLEAQFDDGPRQKLGAIAALPYRATTNLSVRLKFPENVSAREKHVLKLHLTGGGEDVSRSLQQSSTTEPARELVEIFPKTTETRKLQVVCVVQKAGASVKQLAESQFQNVMERIPMDYLGSNMVIFLGSGSDLKGSRQRTIAKHNRTRRDGCCFFAG